MPTLLVTLECSSPTNEVGGLYRTLVHVTDAELLAGEHLQIAVRRACILGYGGPHRTLEHASAPLQSHARALPGPAVNVDYPITPTHERLCRQLQSAAEDIDSQARRVDHTQGRAVIRRSRAFG